MQRKLLATMTVLASLGLFQAARILSLPDKVSCDPIPGGIAVCLNRSSQPVSWSALVRRETGGLYAPLEDLTDALKAKPVVSPDRKHVTINGNELSKTNGVTNTLEMDGKLYVRLLDASHAAGYQVVADKLNNTVSILRP